MVLIDLVMLVVVCAWALAALPARPQPLTDRWISVMRDLTRPESFEGTVSLVPEAAARNCTAMVLSDRAFQPLGEISASERASYRALHAELASQGMDLIPTVVLMGYGRSILRHDPNLAEGLPVRYALFRAEDGGAVHVPDPPPRSWCAARMMSSVRKGETSSRSGIHVLTPTRSTTLRPAFSFHKGRASELARATSALLSPWNSRSNAHDLNGQPLQS